MKKANLKFQTTLTPVKAINPELTLCECLVQSIGKNNNYTNFSYDNVLKALPTLDGIPVIGHVMQKPDGTPYVGGHDESVVVDDDGDVNVQAVTVPYGFVYPETSQIVKIVESGEVKNYVKCDVVLWTGRYPEIVEAGYNNSIDYWQSMEIEYSNAVDLQEDKRYLDIVDYWYQALCLLGKSDTADYNTEPCFPSASVKAYSLSTDETFKKEFEKFKQIVSKSYKKEPEVKNMSDINTPVAEPSTETDTNKGYSDLESVYKAKIELLEQQYKALSKEFETYKSEYTTPDSEVQELRDYKATKEFEEHKAEMEAVFADFEDLKCFTEFKALMADYSAYETADALRNACYVIRGKNAQTVTYSKQVQTQKVPVYDNPPKDTDDDPYGGEFKEYFE